MRFQFVRPTSRINSTHNAWLAKAIFTIAVAKGIFCCEISISNDTASLEPKETIKPVTKTITPPPNGRRLHANHVVAGNNSLSCSVDKFPNIPAKMEEMIMTEEKN